MDALEILARLIGAGLLGLVIAAAALVVVVIVMILRDVWSD